jgi:hypothetical protein
VVLTVADNGVTVRLRPGQRVQVVLASQANFGWRVPGVVGTAVRKTAGSGGFPSSQPARATFLAVLPGKATLVTMDDFACLHVHPACLPAQELWRVTVVVNNDKKA